MRFWKYQGIGNDFVLIESDGPKDPDFVRTVCDRRFGIGADGILYLSEDDVADARMRIMNADGTEAEMCGNGIRCVAKHLRDTEAVPSDTMTIDTLAGVLTIDVSGDASGVRTASVDMGAPRLDPSEVPMVSDDESLERTIKVGERIVRGIPVSMGNPHFVVFEEVPKDERRVLGPAIESHEAFPNRVNVEFVDIVDGRLEVEVFERGVGWTLACGTGACAVGAAACASGRMPFGEAMTVSLPGGDLRICVEDGMTRVMMSGPAELVFVGEYGD